MLFNSLETLIVPGILPLVYIVYFGKHWLNPTLCSYFTGENSRAPKGEITCPPSHRAHGFSQTRNPTTVPSKALFNFCWRRGSLALGRWGWGVVENLYRWRTWMVESQACGSQARCKGRRRAAASNPHASPPLEHSLSLFLRCWEPAELQPIKMQPFGLRNQGSAMSKPGEKEIHKSQILSPGKCTFLYSVGEGSWSPFLFLLFNKYLCSIYIPGTSHIKSLDPHNKPMN